MRAPDSQSEEASTHDVLDAHKTGLYRSAVARLNYKAVDRGHTVRCASVLQVRVEPKSRRLVAKIREGMSRHGDHVRVTNSTKKTHRAKLQ